MLQSLQSSYQNTGAGSATLTDATSVTAVTTSTDTMPSIPPTFHFATPPPILPILPIPSQPHDADSGHAALPDALGPLSPSPDQEPLHEEPLETQDVSTASEPDVDVEHIEPCETQSANGSREAATGVAVSRAGPVAGSSGTSTGEKILYRIILFESHQEPLPVEPSPHQEPLSVEPDVEVEHIEPSTMSRKDGGSRQLTSSLNSGLNLSTSALVEAFRKTQMEYIRKKFAEYGEPYRVGEYKNFNMYYDSGDPSMFWLHADTKSLNDLQRYIQKSVKNKTVGDGGGEGVQEGSLVLARYHVDKLVYRAKVEKVVEGVFSVRYIDYGNKGENLSRSDIYSWDTLLNMIPPQAVSCTLHQLYRGSDVAYTEEQLVEFKNYMTAKSPMKMTVLQCLTSPKGPDVVVSLRVGFNHICHHLR